MTATSPRITTAQRVADLVKAEPRQYGASTVAHTVMRRERDDITGELGLVDDSMRDLWDALHTRDLDDQRDAAQDIADAAACAAIAAIRIAALAQDVLAEIATGGAA